MGLMAEETTSFPSSSDRHLMSRALRSGNRSFWCPGESIFGDPRHLYPKADGSWALVQQMEQGDWATSVQLFDHDLKRHRHIADHRRHLPKPGRLAFEFRGCLHGVGIDWKISPQKTIQGSVLSTGQGTISDEMQLSDDVDGADQVAPVVDANESGRLVVAWLDFRDIVPGIYFQLYDETGDPEGANVLPGGRNARIGRAVLVWISMRPVKIVIAWDRVRIGQA